MGPIRKRFEYRRASWQLPRAMKSFPSRALLLVTAGVLFLTGPLPLSAQYFVNRMSRDIVLYPSSGDVIVLEPNQCAKTWSNQRYVIMYYTHAEKDQKSKKVKARFQDARARCLAIAGRKMQCTRLLRVGYKKAGAIWLEGDRVQTGVLKDFTSKSCFGKVKRI